MKTAVLCIANNEDHYLQEWIDYHVKLGFTDVFVFQNNWRFNPEHENPQNVHLIEFDGKLMMNPCYNGFIQKYYNDYDFALFIDADEFLFINNGLTLDKVLENYLNEDDIYINWRNFGDNGLEKVENNEWSCIKRFTKCGKYLHRLGKNFLNFKKNGNRYTFYNPHIVLLDGQIIKYSDTNNFHAYKLWDKWPDTEHKMEIIHYQSKTWEEFYNRKYKRYDCLKGENDQLNNDLEFMKKEFAFINQNEIEETKVKDFMYGK